MVAPLALKLLLAPFCGFCFAESEKQCLAIPTLGVGLATGNGVAVIWPLLIGLARAKEYLMTGDTINANEAERIGLVNRVVTEKELMLTALALARHLASGPTSAISWTKMAINKLLKSEVNLILDNSLAWENHCFHTEDFREASTAFVEKRKPVFKGK